ncbi:transglycosylase SLT domain-containing protein [Parahaliea maris]|uniref:Transglycosylase SLT domain-containing protein n=1 Tax=Parahaliea maris TaxID=2716870 RepID=A0A5C8ZZJ5_9GAMM|nr:transglycosylase SLT domain-containing protein [Parahaliea maris]TXS92817.1 transglycosylase SLT domain-containing protein [Parahaliea maris]
MRCQNWLVLVVALVVSGWASMSTGAPAALDEWRTAYQSAQEALEKGRTSEYRRLRATLDGYPLALYLDYYELRRRSPRISRQEAMDFVSASEGSPLTNRFLGGYLERAGKDRRWDDFLALMPAEPNSIELKCYYFRARLATGFTEPAWEGARRLWVHGESRPKPCDPLFSAWMKAGQLDDSAVWERMLLAFDARERSLMRYVARKASSELGPWADRLQQVYDNPRGMRNLSLPVADPRSRDVLVRGLVYLARYRPEQALDYWQRFEPVMPFTGQQVKMVESAIALRSLFAKSEVNRAWLDDALGRVGDDGLVEIRLRWALEEQDWAGMDRALAQLSAEGRQRKEWRYWQARIYDQRGQTELATGTYAELARERDYYGFLAADRLGVPYRFNEEPLELDDTQRAELLNLPGLQRAIELDFQEEPANMQAEWSFLLGVYANDPQQQLRLGAYATEQGWHNMAIAAAGQARAWNAVNLRFPTSYSDIFQRYGSLRNVPSHELMAIARRESSFYPRAHSTVGARGLMQIMPATGRQVARRLGVSSSSNALYQVDHNVMLGSAYYSELLKRYQGNRLFALAAYNAGPSRVDRWRNKAGETVPVEVWAETIPYRETRNYVKTILEYAVVFQHLMGEEPTPVLSAAERSAAY